jgi:hypothetical protein
MLSEHHRQACLCAAKYNSALMPYQMELPLRMAVRSTLWCPGLAWLPEYHSDSVHGRQGMLVVVSSCPYCVGAPGAGITVGNCPWMPVRTGGHLLCAEHAGWEGPDEAALVDMFITSATTNGHPDPLLGTYPRLNQ